MGYSAKSHLGKRDLSSAGIVAALRKVGATVTDLGAVGGGVPDLLVTYRGSIHLIEVKSATTHARRAKDPTREYGEFLTDDQVRWLAAHQGPPVRIVTNVEEALAVLGLDDEAIESAHAEGRAR